MRINAVPLDAVEPAYEIARVCQAFDQPDVPFPSLDTFRSAVEHPWPGYVFERCLGLLDDVPVGYLEMGLPQDDNLSTVNVELSVLPSARRHGVGRALHTVAVARTRALGRTYLIGPTVQRHPDGAAFAAAMGAAAGLTELRSRLDVRALAPERVSSMLTEAWTHADGYELVRWTGVPPEEIIEDVAYLDGRLNADAPVGDLAWEPEKVDAEKVRQAELSRIARGRTSYHTGALRDGRLVAWTAIAGAVDEPAQAWQNITLVDPEHRGHRLGLIVKLANLSHVRELRPGIEVIDTFNAATNEHMLAINRMLGFRVVESVVQWQQSV
jgi:GNAT superfamily N-acetyltransferase